MSLFNTYVKTIESFLLELDKADGSGSHFLKALKNAPNIQVQHYEIERFFYAASGRELRDTSNDLVHKICDQINAYEKNIFKPSVWYDLYPESEDQKQQWVLALDKYKDKILNGQRTLSSEKDFRDEGCLRFALTFCKIEGVNLIPGRVRGHLDNFDGSECGASLPLSLKQIEKIQQAIIKLLS